jgi:hypothetical protein
MPVAQQDSFLRCVALTAFSPYENDIFSSGEDVITILTPLYRVLCVLATITLERLGRVPRAESLLPYKPRTQFSESRYASFLEVACSLWTEVCHAYVSQFSRRVHELYCFNIDGSQVWKSFSLGEFLSQ